MAKMGISNEKKTKNVGESKTSWFSFILCFHIIILYFAVYVLFSDLQHVKQTVRDFNENFINLTAKEIQLQMKVLQGSSPKVGLGNVSSGRRVKRDIIFKNTSRFDSTSFTRKSQAPDELFEHVQISGKGVSERRSHSERRGKKNKKKNRRKHGHGPLPRASHFIGAFPEPVIRDGGLLAPWLVEDEPVKDFGLVTKVPSMSRDSIEIAETGLYFIYAQVYYITSAEKSKAVNSFLLRLKPSSGPEKTLSKCATLGDASLGGEASCYTGFARTFIAGDQIYMKQRERDRHIIMRPGQTFLGIILLNKKNN